MLNQSLEKAIDIAGGVTALANAIGARQTLVSQWRMGHRPISPKWCLPIEDATSGQVTRYDLRPDIFGEPTQAA